MVKSTINVTKRSGAKEPLQIEKWQQQIRNICDGVPEVSQSMIEIKAQMHFYDGITTKEIDGVTLRAIVDLIDEETNPTEGNVNYQYVAGKQRSAMLRKDVFGGHSIPRLYDVVKKNVGLELYTSELLEWYTEQEWDMIDGFIDHTKDEKYTYAAIEQIVDKYLVRNRATSQIYETPQIRYAIAAATAFHNEKTDRLKWVEEYYKESSDGMFTLATPVLAGLGTKTKQFSSCVLIKSDDTLNSIFASGEMMARYASKRAGIGLEVGRLRPLGSPIRNGEITHTGLIPFLQKWFRDLRCCSQGGIRNSAATITYPIWHYQFEEMIVLKNNQGTEETRIRQLDYSVVLSGFFFQRLLDKKQITFFDPNQVPDLYEAYYRNHEEFVKLYQKYEQSPNLKKKTLNAEDVFNHIIKERTDTGRIYLVFIDNVGNQTPFDVLNEPIYQSNLCQEILLPTIAFENVNDEKGRIALCTLGSLNWGMFKRPEDTKKTVRILHRSLCNLLDYQDFLSIQSHLSNQEHMPLGIGITGLAHWHAKRGLKYGEPEALAAIKLWQEHISFYGVNASVDVAKERGACTKFFGTKYGQGIFPWEMRKKAVDELTDFTPTLDWNGLRARIKKYGMRNSTLWACPPVESSSVVVNSTNGIEMPMSLITTKESKGGSLVQVVPDYRKLKNKYQLMWEQKDCIDYLKTAAVINVYVDQAISTNTFYNPAHFPDNKVPKTLILKNIMLSYRYGLKTLYYSLIQKTGTKNAVNSNSDDVDNDNNQLDQYQQSQSDVSLLSRIKQALKQLFGKTNSTQSTPVQSINKPIVIVDDQDGDCEACKL